MLRNRLLAASLIAACGMPAAVFAQQGKSREQVNAEYAEKYNQLEAEHIVALSKVAKSEEGDAANATYRLLFQLAIARNEYPAAEPAAEHVIEHGGYAPDVEMLAHFVNVIAEADQGKFEESLDDLKKYMETHKENRAKLDPDSALTIGEAYLQRLIGAGKHDIAAQLCEFAQSSPHEAVREHFKKRAKRLGMVGSPAPKTAGTTIDGKSVDLADHKGKVVLVDFWATWCPPCSLQMVRLNAIREKYKDQDFAIIGVNVDGLREGATAQETEKLIRRFILDHQANFPSIVCKDNALPKAYGVEEIPANFLVDRQGNIIQFELTESGLVRAIEDALKQ